MFAEIQEKYGGLDVCINNAGFAHGGSMGANSMGILNGETDKWRDMLDVSQPMVISCKVPQYENASFYRDTGVIHGWQLMKRHFINKI